MAAKGSRIKRILDYFREVDRDEARVVAQLAAEILQQRNIIPGPVAVNPVMPVKPRKPRQKKNGAPVESTEGAEG